MRVIVTGSGQLARELQRSAPASVELVALARDQLDVTSRQQVQRLLQEISPHALINAAAYTAVDRAENERQSAFAVNCEGPALLAEHCEEIGAFLLHLSTDFVFDGMAYRPYPVGAKKNPINVYGESKSAGEEAVAASKKNHWAIIRTAWVYSSHGNNFVKSMLRLMAEKPELGIVGDQLGTPTWARGLARICWKVLENQIEGIYHWTDAGVASWYDFAVAIQRLGVQMGLLAQTIPLRSIASEEYPTSAERPSYSVLDKSKILTHLSIDAVHWQDQLAQMMAEIAAE